MEKHRSGQTQKSDENSWDCKVCSAASARIVPDRDETYGYR